MLNNKMWNIFKKTGNIEAYLYYKQYNNILESKKNQSMTLTTEILEATKTNYL